MSDRWMGFSLLMFGIVLMSCTSQQRGLPEEKLVETAVAATLQSSLQQPPEVVLETPPEVVPLASETPSNLNIAIPEPGELQIAYTNDGNIWWIDGPATPIQLTSSGYATRPLISDDGSLIAFVRNNWDEDTHEIRVVNTSGGPERVLLDQADFDALYPLDGASHIAPSQLAFLPGSHKLIMNSSASFVGPGLFKFDDLILLDLDSGRLEKLLAPGDGGDFTISPDGTKVALVRPSEIGFSETDGTNLKRVLVTFDPVITYSEFSFYPLVTWSIDSSNFIVVVPEADPFAPEPAAEVWRVNTKDATSHSVATINGHTYFPQLSGHPVVPTSLSQIAFLRDTVTPNVSDLYYANIDGSGAVPYANGDIQWSGWHDNSENFIYETGSSQNQLGSTAAPASPFVEGMDIRWIDEDEFLFLNGSIGAWTLMRGGLSITPIPIVSPGGDFIEYDFLMW